ncbi:MAG: hypothetical protein QNJ55_16990 [Xenococcus sp. MO_188.B8]|nr:hypothetical protein [Xenococcus sp. MO_188.B8]
MNDEDNTVFNAIDSQLEVEINGLYKSADETFITFLASSVTYLVIFIVISIIPLPENISYFDEFKRILGFGGGRSASSISLASGIKQRLEKGEIRE